ncbi:Rv3235 family protein [Streptantibioticus parmotrematis]|nr:Rv3235 family protein [Streptantibioticus parmotrematis]
MTTTTMTSTSAASATTDSAGTAGRRAPRPLRRTPSVTAPPSRRDARRPGALPVRQGTRGAAPAAAAPDAVRRDARRAQPHRWFADRLLEVLSGQRPVAWMLGHTAGEAAYDRLWQLASQGVLRPPKGRPVPLVRGCGCRAVAPGVLEAFARVASGDASRALAFRLERGIDLRWRCTAVDTAGPSW